MGVGPYLEAYCKQCGYVPGPGSHDFKCPKCGYDKGWGLRGRKKEGVNRVIP
jgi:Zn finger protein HypA/HybF involved in hydrogenase expression